jgi:hypothetical protein
MVETILDRLVADLSKRQQLLRADRNRQTFYLKECDPIDLIHNSYGIILKGLQTNGTLTEIIVRVGRQIRRKLRLPQASVLDAHAGWFVVVTFIECGIIKHILKHTYRKGRMSKRQSYHLVVSDYEAVEQLWTLIDITKVSSFPLKEPAPDWTSHTNANGYTLIKKSHPDALAKLPTDPDDILYRNLNKLQRQGWVINRPVFSVFQQCMRLSFGAQSPFKVHREIDKKKQKSLMMEIEAIERIGLAHINEPFYHEYNYDFRGRVYVNTSYLHEQSSDNAKGLLLFKDRLPLGRDGYRWLAIHTANSFGNDKIKLADRVRFVDDNIELFKQFAREPMANRAWMDTDKPFTFLACCFELLELNKWTSNGNKLEDYPCSLPCYIDGSNNGVQHLAALSQDESIAHLVNLVPQELPGDVYKFIAIHVWEILAEMGAKLTESEKEQFDGVFEKIRSLQKRYADAPPKSEEKAIAYAEAQEWRNVNRSIREKLFPIFWLRIDNPKDHRKIVKRNVMTLGYGGTEYGMGQQIIEDTRDMSDYLRDKEHLWGALLGNLVFKTCYEKLPGPAKMLRLFQQLAAIASERKTYLAWTVPVINFPVVQAYRQPATVRTKLRYGDEEIKIQLEVWEEATVDETSQRTGAAPNIVHSFDAAHLGTVVDAVKYPISVVHDSFGCHPSNMDDLFMVVRAKFVLFYAHDPLRRLLEELDCMELMPELGTLDINQVLYSDYAFC